LKAAQEEVQKEVPSFCCKRRRRTQEEEEYQGYQRR